MELLGRGFARTGTSDSLPEAASFVQTVENRQKQKIAEEVAFLNGWKRRRARTQSAQEQGASFAARYLERLPALRKFDASRKSSPNATLPDASKKVLAFRRNPPSIHEYSRERDMLI